MGQVSSEKVETNYLGPPKIEGIEDLSPEQEDENQRQFQARTKLTLVAPKAAQYYEKYITNYEYVTTEMYSLVRDEQCFLADFLLLLPPILKAKQIHVMEKIEG